MEKQNEMKSFEQIKETNESRRNSLERKLNKNLIFGYALIALVLVIGYSVEILKHTREVEYLILFSLFALIPLAVCIFIYRLFPGDSRFHYWVLFCYFSTYMIALFMGKSGLEFTYILPILALLMLYHCPNLILYTGVATMIVNMIQTIIRFAHGEINIINSRNVEIQYLLLILCFTGSYVSSFMYQKVHNKNEEYTKALDERNQQIQDMTLQTIETIANTIDAKDMYTKGHSRRVSIYAKHIAIELGMSEKEIEDVIYIGLLHDIGKIAVPDSILNKPGKLTDSEYALMKEHTIKGGEIFKDITMVEGLDLGAKYHHERYDGKGYPEGLKGEQIPLVARIICLADSFDAMTSTRVYRKKLSMDVVIAEIKRCRGSQFDPVITDAFLRYLNESDFMREIEEVTEAGDRGVGIEVLKKYMKGQAEQIAENAERDELTKVYNRSAGERYISASVKNTLGCILLINLDNMREINNRFGFRRGDYYLQQVVHLLYEVDKNIQISRFGGDEFLCFFPGLTQKEEISRKLDSLLNEVHNMEKRDPFIINMSLSIGVVIHDNCEQSLQSLLLMADKALYHVKQATKNDYFFYEDTDHIKESFSKAELAKLIEQLKKKDNFSESTLLNETDLKRISQFISDVEEGRLEDVSLVMLTAKPDRDDISVEAREIAMQYVDQAIKNVMRDDNALVRYSSLQRIVIMTGTREEVNDATERIKLAYIDSYTKQNVQLSVIIELVKK